MDKIVLESYGWHDILIEIGFGIDYLNIEEQANILSKVLNLKISAVSISISDSIKKLNIPFSGKYGKSTYRKMFNYYSDYGLRGNSKILKMLLGRKPTTFYDFAKKTFK